MGRNRFLWEKKEKWLRKYVELPNGIPSHDTINRTISAIDPLVLQERFVDWVREVAELSKGEVVNIDGKRLCGCGKDGKGPIVQMVSAGAMPTIWYWVIIK